MNETTLARIADDYRSGLAEFLAQGGEPGLAQAYELGRRALNEGVGLLELLAIHREAVASLPDPGADSGSLSPAAHDFLNEAMSPFEITHRGFREANSALHRINERLESEAQRIAHVVHDDLGALLVTIHLALKQLEPDLLPSGREPLEGVRTRLNELENRLRDLSHELRPTILDDLGLVPALRVLAQGISMRSGLRVDVVDGVHRWLPPVVQLAVYRIVQEALANVVRHARATHASVKLARRGEVLQCSIRDNGIGMQPPSKKGQRIEGHGLGLLGIRERLDALGGTLRIDSSPGQGAELLVTVPLEAP
jgi:signal transduction histidine kinase